MSTNIGKLKNTGSRNVDMDITRFWGGKEKGVCVQLTALEEDGSFGYVQLSVQDILTLIPVLKKEIINPEMERIKDNCNKLIKENKELKETIVKDHREVSKMLLEVESYELANLLFYGKQEFENESSK